MKKNYAILILLCTIYFNINAQSVALPQSFITASPMGTVENNGSTTAGFTLTESSGQIVPATALGLPNVTINVNLQYVQLKDLDANLITGDLLTYFTVTYNSSTNSIIFKQNSDIPASWSGSVMFPIDAIQNSTQGNALNGFNANISAVDRDTNADGNASIFTYTDSSVLSVHKINTLLFQLSPNPTTDIINIKLDEVSDTKVELFNILGKNILTKQYTNLDKISLNIDYLSPAVYLIKVTANNGATNTMKILKK